MLRFAVSPTSDLKLDTLRIALYNYIVAKQRGEDFIVRIEDMEKERVIDGMDDEILDLLALFGVQFSQVIHQSQNVRFHSAMALQLVHERKAFSCFCSDNWLENKREEAEKAGREYSYDDACRNLPAELIIDNTNPFSIRVTRPDADIIIHDKILGDKSFTPDKVDSFVILNQDKIPTYNFAVGVDDMLSDISLIIRSEEFIEETPKQEHVRAVLKYEKQVEYAHLPKMENLENALNVKELLKEGFLPEAILNYLVLIGNKAPKEIFTLEEAIEFLDLKKVSTTSVSFDINNLKKINRAHLRALDAKELSRYVGFADAEIGALARVYLEEVSTTRELKTKIAPIFAERKIPDSFAKECTTLTNIIKGAPYFEEYTAFKDYIIKESGLGGETYLMPLRLLLTNATEGPDIAEIYQHLKNYIGEIVK